MTLGGAVCIRNGNQLDYCWQLSVQSLLPVCDEVVVCDGESTDGTQEEIRKWAKHEPKIKVCIYPWPNPKGIIDYWVEWLNYAREHTKSDFQIQLDADEIVSESSYGEIEQFKKRSATERVSLWCRRYNFWSDARHLIPHGVCCGHRVVRVGPQSVWMPSDGPHPRGAEMVGMAVESGIEIFHYGFLRKREAFFAKSRAIQEYFFNNYDPRMEDVEKVYKVHGDEAESLKGVLKKATEDQTDLISAESEKGNWMQEIKGVEWINRLIPFNGIHPKIAHEWLTQRGYNL